MWPKQQFPKYLVAFTKETLNGNLHFFMHCKLNDEKEMSEENSLAREIYRLLRGLSPRKWMIFLK